MRHFIMQLSAWIAANPEKCVTAFAAVFAVVAATLENVRKNGPPKTWRGRFVDRLAARTRKGADNEGWTWPLFAKSVFHAAIESREPTQTWPIDDTSRETIAPTEPEATEP